MAQQSLAQQESAMQLKFRIANAIVSKGGTIRCSTITQKDNSDASCPMWYFFYGSLKDPSTLASIAGLERPPNVIYAKVCRSEIRYWGQHAVLVYGKTSAVVEGVAWFVPSAEMINRLRAYETDMYYDGFVEIEFGNGQKSNGKDVPMGWRLGGLVG